MTPETAEEPRLTEEAKAVIWQIFGKGASPRTRWSPYELIEPVFGRRLSPAVAAPAIVAVRAWFEAQGDRQWLKSEMNNTVATMILEHTGAERGETAIWAVGSIDAGATVQVIRSIWSAEDIDSFVDCTIPLLAEFSRSDRVLDAALLHRSYSADARITIDPVEIEGRIKFFQELDKHGFDLVHRALHPPAGNLLALVANLRPKRFAFLVDSLDHPVMQTRAAHHMAAANCHSVDRALLHWIAKESSDALIALAIVHTLNFVNKVDRVAENEAVDQAIDDAEPHDLPNSLDSLDKLARELLDCLVKQLALLDPPECARWIGELLSSAPYALHSRSDQEPPRRILQLERACTTLCAQLVRDFWTPDLLAGLKSGLRHTPRITWTRHLAEIARKIREVEPFRAAELARDTLEEHDRQIAAEIKHNHAYLSRADWHDREWYGALGIALSLSCDRIDLPSWVKAKCAPLPLSVWDAEENHSAFSTAVRVAQHWFLVAFHAIPMLEKLERPADPAAIRELAKAFWAHCSFAGKHVLRVPDASEVEEFASRCLIEYGQPSEAWLFEQMRNPGLGARSIWALLDQRKKKGVRGTGMQARDDEAIAAEFRRIASDRFGDGGRFGLDALHYWGLLWLLLGAAKEAEMTAAVMLALDPRAHDRRYRILALKLLALGSAARPLSTELADLTASLYKQLWPGYTLPDERPDRDWIDEMLQRSAPRA